MSPDDDLDCEYDEFEIDDPPPAACPMCDEERTEAPEHTMYYWTCYMCGHMWDS